MLINIILIILKRINLRAATDHGNHGSHGKVRELKMGHGSHGLIMELH